MMKIAMRKQCIKELRGLLDHLILNTPSSAERERLTAANMLLMKAGEAQVKPPDLQEQADAEFAAKSKQELHDEHLREDVKR